MKKTILLVSCLVSLSLLAGCNNHTITTDPAPTSQENNYHLVKFMYNSGFKPGEIFPQSRDGLSRQKAFSVYTYGKHL